MSDKYDSPWKDMLERYIPQFMAFFFPVAYADIDWSRGWQSLDQELHQVVRDAESGKRFADKLLKVHRLNNEELYVVIHIEIQGDHDVDFPLRMYIYNYRLFDRHLLPVVSLAVLCDDSAEWRPRAYGYQVWGCKPGIEFPIVKLSDYTDRWAELEASTNAFAVVVMSTLKARATRGDMPNRLRWKMHLVRGLYEKDWDREHVLELLRFIDWVLALPPGLDKQLKDKVEKLETEKNMRYVTSFERLSREEGLAEGLALGKEQGKKQGLEQGKKQWLEQGKRQGKKQGFLLGEASVVLRLLKCLLKRRFERIPGWVEERLERASRDELEGWLDRALEAKALEDVFA